MFRFKFTTDATLHSAFASPMPNWLAVPAYSILNAYRDWAYTREYG